jgi:biotin-dependent carboxylase-like uncharacterized protein
VAIRRDERGGGAEAVNALETVRPGLFTTVQDSGRVGVSRWGVPASGSADPFSARAANWLAGNAEGAAVLEVTLGGAEFALLADCRLGIAGARADVAVNGSAVPPRRALFLRAGDRVAVGVAVEGLRVYVAVSGGIDVPAVLGSRATLTGSRLGGFQGRRLAAGDRLPVGTSSSVPERTLPDAVTSRVLRGEARVVAGPQLERFPAASREAFFGGAFRVSTRSDRRGLRLEGPRVAPSDGDIEPEGVVVGAIQVPGGGEPIALMPDGPVTGGYPKIATVIRTDLPVLGQWRPGQEVRFREVTREEAIAVWREGEATWRELDAEAKSI